MLRRLGIRAKVLAVLAVPMFVVLLAGAFISWETLQNLRTEQNVRNVVAAATAYVAVSNALNEERSDSQTGQASDVLTQARQKTDAAVAVFVPALAKIDTSPFPTAVADGVASVQSGLKNILPTLRGDVDGGLIVSVDSGYNTIVDDQLALLDNLAAQIGDREVATSVSAYVAIERTVSSLSQEEISGRQLLLQTNPTVAAGQAYTALAGKTEVNRQTARVAVADLGVTGVRLPADDPTANFTRDRGALGTGSASGMSAVKSADYTDEIASQRTSLTKVADSVMTHANAASARAISAAQQRTFITIALTLLALIASFLLALVISRTIVIPLRRLTAAATDLREELPHLVEQVQSPGEGPQMTAPQIPVTSRDEVGRLASAFNAVNLTTFQVAQEQAALRGSIAEMFVNVARRDQVLLNRQLSFIDSLERTEEDPQALSNLFRLDHLATRMRRNAESLLVLAGIDSGRRLRDALPLSDVVRTASSEIEQYDRVELDLQADPHMLGFNALPAAHLLAELLENATVFSEPETPVVVTTSVAGAHVEVRIVDEGLGMSDAELAAANEKIAATSASDALGAQRLGLFVVGRLAQRLGAEVEIRKNSRGATGTETVVRFPATLFQSTEASPLGVYGDAAASQQPEVPALPEVDLASLTEGVTEQGLPRRRTTQSARSVRTGFDESSIVLPDVTASALPAELSAAGGDWAPLVVPDQSGTGTHNGAELPSRQPAASAPGAPVARPGGRIPAIADPAARAGMFAGFRGRGDRAAVPTPVESPEPEPPALVIPGLAPDEDWAPGQVAASFWTLDEPSTQQAATGEAPTWSSGAPSGQARDEFVPAAFTPQPPTAQAPLFGRAAAEPWAQPEAPTGEQPATAEGEEPAVPGTAAPAAPAAPAVETEVPAVERWTPPEVDLTQWALPVTDAPAFEPRPDAFPDLSGWSSVQGPGIAEDAPYAPFGRSLDEAQAWATGAVPVVPEPVGFPGSEPVPALSDVGDGLVESSAWSDWNTDGEQWSIPPLEGDHVAPTGAAAVLPDLSQQPDIPAEEVPPAVAAYVPEPVATDAFVPGPPLADVAEPIDLPVTPTWAPTAATESFHELVHGADEGHAHRRGWFGRRKERAAPAPAAMVPTPTPVVAPPVPVVAPAPAPALPVRSSAWAPAAGAPVREPFPRHEPAPEPVAVAPASAPVQPAPAPPAPDVPAAPAVASSWAPQGTWTPPVATTLPDGSAGRGAAWSAPEWSTPRTSHATGAAPTPAGASAVPEHAAPRIGTLDDEVAAMLALRSDIQEQALSELSQLSAYRPQVMAGSERLTRRVPTAVPEAPEIVESTTERDPDEVRSRLASFQSGTARGRRDASRDEETS